MVSYIFKINQILNRSEEAVELATVIKSLGQIKELTFQVSKFITIDTISTLYEDLLGVNTQLWEVEDEIRILENQKVFNDKFIQLARSVYYLNDERFSIKNKINVLTDSEIQEVKQYIDYK